MAKRVCTFTKPDGTPCGATPLRDSELCFWHDPDHAEEAAEARRVGRLRQRRENSVKGAYDFGGLATVGDIRRYLEIGALDLLALESSIGRANAMARIAQVAVKALEVEELVKRIEVFR